MRTIYGRQSKLGFGKHRARTLAWVAGHDSDYLAWLKRENVVRLDNQKDQAWFELQAEAAEATITGRRPYSNVPRAHRDCSDCDGFELMDMPSEFELIGHFPGDS